MYRVVNVVRFGIIGINDGSTDNSDKMFDRYADGFIRTVLSTLWRDLHRIKQGG